MPDLISVLARRWKMMVLLTMIATGTAFLACLLRPKEYAGVTTALPANSLVGDKARIFHQTIDALYPEVGTPDELDKIEEPDFLTGLTTEERVLMKILKELV